MLHQEHRSLPQVGAQDPELRNSPIVDEEDEETEIVRQQQGAAACLFNGKEFAHDTYVASGSQVLRCNYGVWIDSGSADPRNP